MANYKRKGIYATITEHCGSSNEDEGRKRMAQINTIKDMFVPDEIVRLKVRGDSKRIPYRYVEGKVIQKNDFLVAIKTNRNVESFNYSEFLMGSAKVI